MIIIIIGVDPVCAAAAQSYFDATLAGDSDEAASEKAATAYLRYILSPFPFHKIFFVYAKIFSARWTPTLGSAQTRRAARRPRHTSPPPGSRLKIMLPES